MKRNFIVIALLFGLFNFSFATDYFVSINGNDASGNGSQSRPWRTLYYALSKVPAKQGHTIKLSAGTFIERGPLKVPLQVNIEGAGSSTIIKGASSFHHRPSGGWSLNKFLFQLTSSGSMADGNQYLKNFILDGDDKKLYGGIMVNGRKRILIDGVAVRYTGFVGIWLLDVTDSRVTNVDLKDCAWFTSSYATGGMCLSDIERVEIDHIKADDRYGAGIKHMGVNEGKVYNCKIHDNWISTSTEGRWVQPSGSTTPPIALELFRGDLRGNEVYNNTFEGNVSIAIPAVYSYPSGTQTVRIYNNVFDMMTRANGNSYGLELSVNNVEVDHNYFYGGNWGITDWWHSNLDKPNSNWKIHHNVFYDIEGSGQPGIVRSEKKGFRNLEFYNNTVEMNGQREISVVQVNGGSSSDIKIKNNLIINNTTGPYRAYPPQFIRVGPNARISGVTATHNFLQNLPIGNVPGTYSNNQSGDPQINKTGARPDPYYKPKSGSPLIDKGTNVGFPYSGSAPDIGAYEYGETTTAPANKRPQGSVASPANNSTFAEGVTIKIQANAADADGTVTKVEFFIGTDKLGEDSTSPYDFDWKDATAGTYKITVRVTDNDNASTTSTAVTVTVVAASNADPEVSITSPSTNTEVKVGETITIRADAADDDGGIEKVEFYTRTTKLGEDNTSPYTFEWPDALPGDHRITAKATDDKGATATSPAVRVLVVADENEAPTVAMSSPANNSTHTEGDAITLRATANDTDGTINKVEFFQGTNKLGEDNTAPYTLAWDNAKVGTYAVTAKATDNKNAVGTSAPLSIHVKTPSNSLPVVELTNPKNGATLNSGNITLSATASDSDGAIAKVEFFSGTTKLGEDLSSPYSFAWSGVKAGKYNLTARATDNKSGSTTSATVTINVIDPNKKPVVVITSPADNASFSQGASVAIRVNATDSDGAITKVEFFNGTNKLGEDTSSPYSYTWTNVPAGSHNITARATDNKSAATTSEVVVISVSAPNKLPLVQLTSPSNNARFNQGASVTLAASATDSDGSVKKVAFYSGNTLLGEDTSSPYSYTWTNVKAGNYTITAKATDNRSGVTTSTAVVITVAVPNKAPVVQITSPADNATFTEGQAVPIKATASDSDGKITRVEFFNGTNLLGEDTSAPYSLEWPNVLPGKYEITARATDNSGAKATAKVSIEVKEQIFVPVANAGNDVSVELPENSVTLNGNGESGNGDIVKYEWAQVEGPEDATIKAGSDGEAVIGNLTEGTYRFELTVTDSKNMKATDVITIRVYPLPLTSVELPRIFSPNGDGINDYWEWSNTELFRDSRLVIFNRYGQKIYEVTSYDNTWDGSVNGSPLQEDAYYYVISSNQGELTGAVRIVR